MELVAQTIRNKKGRSSGVGDEGGGGGGRGGASSPGGTSGVLSEEVGK